MKVSYFHLVIILFIPGLFISACGDSPLAQLEGTSATATTALIPTENVIVPPVTITQAIQVTLTSALATASLTPTLSPTPTMQPNPTPLPSPAFVTLPPLDARLQTIIFTVSGNQGPEIYRGQIDEEGQKIEPLQQINFPTNPRTTIHNLFPSPDGQWAIVWSGGEASTFLHRLNIATGQLSPLFGDHLKIDQRAYFLGWTPDSQRVLAMGVADNLDLADRAWLVDINTQTYRNIDIKQENDLPLISDATFSPDGNVIAYPKADCYQCGSEIWRLNLNEPDQQRLFQSDMYIKDVLWSPDGSYIAFTQWAVDSFALDEIASGELHIITPDGNENQQLSTTLIHFYNDPFRPVWSADSQKLIFVNNEDNESNQRLDALSSNLYIVDLPSKQVHPLTDFQETQVIKPILSPDGSQVVFIAKEKNTSTQFEIWRLTLADEPPRQLAGSDGLTKIEIDTPDMQLGQLNMRSPILWLP